MLSPTGIKTADAGVEEGASLFRHVVRLAPNSGVQFIDVRIDPATIAGVNRHFERQRVETPDGALWALAPVKPRSGEAGVVDTRRITVDGTAVIRAVMDRWIPIPVLRYISRDGKGRPAFDDGPFNWARLHLTADPGAAGGVVGVIALDTQIETVSRYEAPTYLAPTGDDVRFASMFALIDDAERLASFLAEDWVQAWLQSVFQGDRPGERGNAGDGLRDVASYLTLLTVLRKAGALPGLQFYAQRPGVVPAAAVDLVLDLGQSRSCAMLVESSKEDGRPVIANASMLALRDVSMPSRVHRGSFESRIEFSRADFGPEVLSRRSGRGHAFRWPSVVRVGAEAVRLSRATQTADGATGMGSPKAHLRDLAPRAEPWRFASSDATGARPRRSQMVYGEVFSHVEPGLTALPPPDSGRPEHGKAGQIGHDGNATVRRQSTALAVQTSESTAHLALRPRFSLSALSSFFIAEILLQAVSAINSPGRYTKGSESETGDGVRQLRDLIVCLPLSLPLEERDLMRARAEAAIDMLWRAFDWDRHTDQGLVPPRPKVRLGLDETLSGQLAFLFDEIVERHAGDARGFLEVMGKSRPEFGVQPCLRVGAVDIGGGHAHLTIVTYSSVGDAPITPALLGTQRSDIAGDTIVAEIIREILLPAIGAHLAGLGLADPEPFLARAVAPPDTMTAYEVTSLNARMQAHWLQPAAIALIKLYEGAAAFATPVRVSVRLADLVAQSGDVNPHTASEFADAAAAAGARGAMLGDVTLSVRGTDVAAAARQALGPMIARLSRALVATDCDIVLLSGWPARLGVARELLLEAMPWRPDRIVTLHDRAWLDWYPMTAAMRAESGGKDIGLIGALLGLAGGEGGFGFSVGPFAEPRTDAAEPIGAPVGEIAAPRPVRGGGRP